MAFGVCVDVISESLVDFVVAVADVEGLSFFQIFIGFDKLLNFPFRKIILMLQIFKLSHQF